MKKYNKKKIIAVDLDGTIIYTDVFHEQIIKLIKINPLYIFYFLFLIFICLGHFSIYSITFPEARFRFPIDVVLIIYLLFPVDKNDNLKNIFLFIKILINKKIKNFF